MKSNFTSSLTARAAEGRRDPVARSVTVPLCRVAARTAAIIAICVAFTALSGCEALQRKLTRKPKHPKPPPTPIIQFLDYSKAMTPLDRYRKHYLVFDYWNDELIGGLQSQPLNPKRCRRASAEALAELETLKGLVTDEVAVRLAPLIEERLEIDRQIQRGSFAASQANVMWRTLEAQTRRFQREFYWRDVEDHLQQVPPGDTAGP